MMRRLFGVAKRGRVRIVTPAKLDHQWAVGAARFFYWRLLKRGVEIYEYQPTKLHTKLIVIDDVVHIGSANFDLRSLYLNLEMMLRVDDPAFAAMMRRFVDGEIANSKRITPEAHRAEHDLVEPAANGRSAISWSRPPTTICRGGSISGERSGGRLSTATPARPAQERIGGIQVRVAG